MAITVEDGTNVADANAYGTVSDCDAYHLQLGNDLWATYDKKEQALVAGTRYIDLRYSDRFLGTRTFVDQELEWPRDGVFPVGANGAQLAANAIPRAVKEATYEIALLIARGIEIFPNFSRGDFVKSSTDVVGPITERRVYDSGVMRPVFTLIDDMLYPYTTNSSATTVRLIRA